eukprot:scaffold266826_cov24-Prasinocladus_malaysianus.AAC.1
MELSQWHGIHSSFRFPGGPSRSTALALRFRDALGTTFNWLRIEEEALAAVIGECGRRFARRLLPCDDFRHIFGRDSRIYINRTKARWALFETLGLECAGAKE